MVDLFECMVMHGLKTLNSSYTFEDYRCCVDLHMQYVKKNARWGEYDCTPQLLSRIQQNLVAKGRNTTPRIICCIGLIIKSFMTLWTG
jgi:hypothetical protein